MAHLKRLLAPGFWGIPKKGKKWVVCPSPGPHPKFECIPLLIIVRDLLKLAETGKEAKKIIKAREVLVDGRVRRDHRYPAGLFDVIEIPRIKKAYRIVPFSKGLKLIEIPKKETNLKLCRIEDKTLVKGGILQLNLHDGRNILIKNKKALKTYKTGDSILIEVPSQKIVQHLKLEKKMLAIITGGANRGSLVKVKDIIITRGREPNKVVCEAGEKTFEAIKDYVFIVGKEKPVIKVK